MIIKVMPVLHARTFNVDFRTNKLLVEPLIFNDEDSSILYKIAVESTRQRELAPETGRFVVYGGGSYTVVGRTVRFSDLYSSCKRAPKYSTVDSENGRSAYGFVGLMIPLGEVANPIRLTDELILDVYEQSIVNRWNETENDENVFDTLKKDFIEVNVDFLDSQSTYEPLLQQSNTPIILEDNDELREQIIFTMMKLAFSGKKVSLCTSVSKLDSDIFKVVTCKNAVSRVKTVSEAIERLESKRQLSNVNVQPTEDDTNHVFSPGTSSDRSENHTKQAKNNISKASPRESVQSLDDILNNTKAPKDTNGTFRKKRQENNKIDVMDKGLILGTILGITFILIEVSRRTTPLVMAVTSTFTLILAGLEAKRIIDKFK